MLTALFYVALLGAAAFVLGHGVIQYQSATGTGYARALAAAQATFSWAWAGILLAAGGLLDAAGNLALLVNAPEVQGVIAKVPPRYVAYVGVGVAAVRVLAKVAEFVRPLFKKRAANV